MKQRVILHSDMNNFYASVECLHRPEIRGLPVVVGGDEAARHGIVLAKNYIAKASGIKTGETLWQARDKCPGLVTLPPNYPLYLRYAKYAWEIYGDYTDRVQPFGLDEAWLDVTGDDGVSVANDIRRRITRELGVTASVGVSYNKIFAKLGSDLKKPDATSVINRDNYRNVAWPLPVEDLLYVGHATKQKLKLMGVTTIGKLAQTSECTLRSRFGKIGSVLYDFANGLDDSPVKYAYEICPVGSVGNSITTARDLVNDEDVKVTFTALAESVCARLREEGALGRTVVISVRDNALASFERQSKLKEPSCISGEIIAAAMQLFRRHYHWPRPIRSLGVKCADLIPACEPMQLSLFGEEERREKQEAIDRTVDNIRQRFGHFAIQRASVLTDSLLGGINPKGDHIIHPVGYFG